MDFVCATLQSQTVESSDVKIQPSAIIIRYICICVYLGKFRARPTRNYKKHRNGRKSQDRFAFYLNPYETAQRNRQQKNTKNTVMIKEAMPLCLKAERQPPKIKATNPRFPPNSKHGP
jgi:hypothetical protein